MMKVAFKYVLFFFFSVTFTFQATAGIKNWIGKACLLLSSSPSKSDSANRKKDPNIIISTKVKKQSPNKSGLTDYLIQFALKRNHPSQVTKKAEDLNYLLSAIETTEIGADFGVAISELQLIEILRQTKLSQLNKLPLLAAVNRRVDAEGKGEKITGEFLDQLIAIQKKIKIVEKKLVTLQKSQPIEFRYYGEKALIFNPYGEEAQKIYESFRYVYERYRGFFDAPPMEPGDVPVVASYLKSFIAGKMPVLNDLSSALRLLLEFDEKNGTHHASNLSGALFEKSVQKLANYSGERSGLLISMNRDNLSYAAGAALRSALDEGVAIKDILPKFFEFYSSGHASSLLFVLEKIYYISDEKVETYKSLERHFEGISKSFNDSVSHQYAESLFFGFLSVCLEKAKWADSWLSRGMGFHNAERVNTAVEEAAQASELFANLNLRGPQTKDLDFAILAKIFRGLKYDNLGRRAFGDDITAWEAFGIDGST